MIKNKGPNYQKSNNKKQKFKIKVPRNFEGNFKNYKIVRVDRFSKYFILYISNKTICIVHLYMTGTIHIIENKFKNLITNTSFYHSLTLPKSIIILKFF